MSQEEPSIEVKVLRFNPAVDREEKYEVFRVPFVDGFTVSNVLQYINEEFDGGLAHYLSCRRGICTQCMVRVNGKPVLACTEIVKGDLTIEPLRKDWVIKDLVVNRSKRSGGV